MVKYAVGGEGSYRAYDQLTFPAKLGEDLPRTGAFSQASVDRTIQALVGCKESADIDSIDTILLVGTSPVREASNSDAFLARVATEAGLKMRVLSAREEAWFSFLGSASACRLDSVLFFDLGGGSLELVSAVGPSIEKVFSIPLGALKLTRKYAGKDGTYSRKNQARLSKAITKLLPSRKELGLMKDTMLIGSGGTVRALARFEQAELNYPFNKVHNYPLGAGSVTRMNRLFFDLSMEDLRRDESVGNDRAESIAAGSLVVRIMMKKLKFERLLVSTHGLRDGIVAAYLAEGKAGLREGVTQSDIERLVRNCVRSPGRSYRTAPVMEAFIRRGVFDEVSSNLLHLAVSELLSNAHEDVSADSLFWLLFNKDSYLSHRDQFIMALSIVRTRRPRTANWFISRYGNVLEKRDGVVVKKVAAVLLYITFTGALLTSLRAPLASAAPRGQSKATRARLRRYPGGCRVMP
jgi:exopolyphosphatase/guanosine-5'-triphosphate,3'-diphosphate pyrophosphatase